MVLSILLVLSKSTLIGEPFIPNEFITPSNLNWSNNTDTSSGYLLNPFDETQNFLLGRNLDVLISTPITS